MTKTMDMRKTLLITLAAALLPVMAQAQTPLSLEECRQMAVSNNKSLEQARTKVEMAGYDRKIALANYFPDISAVGTYMYNDKDISLISDEMSARLRGAGTAVQGKFTDGMTALMQGIMSNPSAVAEYMTSPMWQTVVGALNQTDLSTAINALGAEIDDALHLDMRNIHAGAVTLKQPLFMGGKIVASNNIARLAEELARAQYDGECQQVIVDVDQAYWQIVSIAAKKELAQSYSDLLDQMCHDVDLAVESGVSTEADALSIRVKANEAKMLLTKATSGLSLAKMLLCKEIGLPLDTDIVLADEGGEAVAAPVLPPVKDFEAIYADRPETRSLELASRIYDKKVAVARADMLPQVALSANYLVSNPTLQDGFQNKWGGMFNAGVVVKVPLFHGFEALQKTRKAKREASLYRSQYDDACELINLQVSQLRSQLDEGLDKLAMCENNLASAEENLRTATIGFEEGVIPSNTALAAQTAWLQAHSEYIDAGIELQMTVANLRKAEGNNNMDK